MKGPESCWISVSNGAVVPAGSPVDTNVTVSVVCDAGFLLDGDGERAKRFACTADLAKGNEITI